MKQRAIQSMIKTKRLSLSFSQLVCHYLSVIWFLIIAIPFTLLLAGRPNQDDIKIYQPGELCIISGFFVAAVLLFFLQRKRLKFIEIPLVVSDENFNEAFQRTTEQLSLSIYFHKKNFIQASREDWFSIWGQMITIIRTKKSILINSICDPNKKSSLTSEGKNRENLLTFINNLEDVLNSIPVKQIPIEIAKNEWSLKKIMMRIVAYPLSIILYCLSIFIIIEGTTFKAIAAAISTCFIVSIYLYHDIKLIIRSAKKL